jgi:hypothetical protein
VTLTLNGGSGVKLTLGANGKAMVDFSGMQPATFTTQLGAILITGQVTYQGTTSGTVDLTGTASPSGSASTTASPQSTAYGRSAPASPSGSASTTASPQSTASGRSGPWNPGETDVSKLQLTVKLTQPIASTLMDNLKVSDVSGAQATQTGNTIDLQPLLRTGTYQCQGEKTLVITTGGGGPVLVWTLARSLTP